MGDPTLLDHGLVAVIAATLLYAILRGHRKLETIEFDTPTKLGFYWSNGIVLWIGAAAVCGVWWLDGRPFEALGFTHRHDAPALTGLITSAFIAWFVVETWHETATFERRAALLARWHRLAPFLPETTREAAHFSFLAITAGVTEEIIFRGFLISYILAFTGGSAAGAAIAVALPAAVFTVAHAYEGRRAMSRILLLSLAFGAIFVASGSLLIPIVLHALVDIVAGVLAVRIATEAGSVAAIERG